MGKLLKKILNPQKYYKELNGYNSLNTELRTKLEYYEKNYYYKDFDKFFSWDEFKEIIKYVHFLLEFQFNGFDINILNDGNEYCYWIEYNDNRIEINTSNNIEEMLNNIKIQGIPLYQIWGNFD